MVRVVFMTMPTRISVIAAVIYTACSGVQSLGTPIRTIGK